MPLADDALLRELFGDLWRSIIWLRSHWDHWNATPNGRPQPYDAEARRRLWLVCELGDGVHMTLVRGGRFNPIAAHALARSTFEAGLACSWLLVGSEGPDRDLPGNHSEIARRHLALVQEQCGWIRRVAKEMSAGGLDGDRWASGAESEHDRLLRLASLYFPQEDWPFDLPAVPSVRNLLDLMNLRRLYHGYMISSQFTHGTAMGARELHPLRTDGFSSNDVSLAAGQVVWGLVLASRAYVRRPEGEGLSLLHGSPLEDVQETLTALWTRDVERSDPSAIPSTLTSPSRPATVATPSPPSRPVHVDQGRDETDPRP